MISHRRDPDAAAQGSSVAWRTSSDPAQGRQGEAKTGLSEPPFPSTPQVCAMTSPTEPAPPATEAKAADLIKTRVAYERWLRSAGGFSKRQASILSKSWSDLAGTEPLDRIAELADAIRDIARDTEGR